MKVRNVKDQPINSDFKKLLLILVQNSKIDADLYNKLNEDEKNIVEMLISGSGLNTLNHMRYNQKNIDDLIEKYNILKGELLIGNNNPELLKDLKLTVLQLVNFNILHMKEILPLLENIFLLL